MKARLETERSGRERTWGSFMRVTGCSIGLGLLLGFMCVYRFMGVREGLGF